MFGSKKSTSVTQNTEYTSNDASQVQGYNATRVGGEGNVNNVTVQDLDADALKYSLDFATKNADGSAKTFADLIGLTGTLASKALDMASVNSRSAIETIGTTGTTSRQAIQDAYKTATGTVNRENIFMIGAAVVAVLGFFMLRSK